MSYEPADEPAGSLGAFDPALIGRADVQAALAVRDIATFYRALKHAGVSQRQIARRTGQSQSEVSEILKGRRVISYDLLVRIAEGFGIRRGMMGLGYGDDTGPDSPPAGEEVAGEDAAGQEVAEEMKRRVLIGATSGAALGHALGGLGELTELALPTGEPLPSRLTMAHVQTVETVTAQLRAVARRFGGQADLFGAVARQYLSWLGVPGSDVLKARLAAALAELLTEAGWCAYDSGLPGHGYFTRALTVADHAGDGFGIVNAAWHAGATLVRSGYPDDALKCFQLGGLRLSGFRIGKATPATVRPDDPRIPSITARLDISSAAAYALLGDPDQAKRYLYQARDIWVPRDAFERADKDLNTARILADLGRLDTAQQFATAAINAFGEANHRGGVLAEITLAEVHVRAGEPRGTGLAAKAIEDVTALQSVAARNYWLTPLTAALEARPGGDARELARMARQVAHARPGR
ncbi:MAG: helix-turn-helix domain-containing protein [Pseudonocardiaceae bacterium]